MEEKITNIHQEHDKLFKVFFKLKETLIEYLENFFPPELLAFIAIEELELDDTSYISPDMKAFYSDVVHRSKLKLPNFEDKGEIPLALAFLLEHKILSEDFIHLQLMHYEQAIWRKDIADNRPLTFVLPIVIYQGKSKWEVKPFVAHFPHLPPPFFKYLPSFEYHFTNARDVDTPKLEKLKGILGSLFLAYKHLDDIKYLDQHISYLFKSFEGKPNLKEIRQIYVAYVVRNAVISGEKLKQNLETLTDKSIKSEIMTTYQYILQEGEVKGKLEGKLEEKRLGIIKALKRRKLTIAEISEDFEVPVEFVLKIRTETGL